MIKFDTDKKKQEAIASFTNLLNDDGWKLVVEILNANIEVLREQLESGSENETLSDVKRIRVKLEAMIELRDTPQTMVSRLESPETELTDPDPFDTLEDVKERKEAEVDKEVGE